LFLNSDTVLLGTDVLEILAHAASDPSVGLAGPRLENPDGSLQPSCAGHLGILRALVLASGIHLLLPDRVRASAAPHRWSHDAARDTDWLMGAAIAIRPEEFAAVRGFWPTLYAEDQDLAYRLQRRGLRVRYEPSARVMHIGNHSLVQRLSAADRAARVATAEVAFMSAHYSRPRAAAIRAILAAGHTARAAAHALLGHRDRARVYRAMAAAYSRGHQP
jgi:GT2 family glycosyltransferase